MSDFWLFKKIRDFHNKYIDRPVARLCLLVVMGIVGLLLGTFLDTQFFVDLRQDATDAKYLAIAVVGMPVVFLLWYFRTRDVRQQIKSSNYDMDNIGIRAMLLVVMGIVGLLLGSFSDPSYFSYLRQGATNAKYLSTVIIVMPVFSILCCFRMRDVRQQIKSSNDYRDNIGIRIDLLIGMVILGLLLGSFLDAPFFSDYLKQNKEVAKHLATAVIGIPAFIFLWYFRTHDVRQQIQQNHFN